jgi:hypothetical protein
MIFGYEIDATYIIAQLSGFVAMGFGMYSYQTKKRVSILTLQAFSNVFWLIQYLLLGRYSAVAANVIGILRNIIYLMRGRFKFADSRIVPIICMAAFVVSGVFTYTAPIDVLPICAMLIATVAFFMDNEQMIRILSLGVAICWFTFGLLAGSIASMISDGITFFTILVAVIRYHRIARYEKNTSLLEVGTDADACHDGSFECENGTNTDRCDEKS